MQETFQQRLFRRSLTITGMFFAMFVVTALFPLLFLLAGAADLLRRRGWILLRVLLFSLWYLALECVGIVSAGLLWLKYLASGRDLVAFQGDNFRLQSWWTEKLALGSSRIFDAPFHVEGQEHLEKGPILLFLRHASLTDTILAGLLVAVPFGIQLRYVLKRELLWDPCLDIVGNRLPNYFVDRSSTNSQKEIDGVAALAATLGEKEGVLIYPEGTRFSPKKRARVLEKLEEGGDAEALARAKELTNLLPPRLGGTLALLERNEAADVVFCAHAGMEKAASFAQLANGEMFHQTIFVRFWRVPYGEIPTERERQIEWLHQHWRAIDEYISEVERNRRQE